MAQVHRFREKVAVHVGKGETVYFSPANARKLARAIYRAAKSCDSEPFTENRDLTVTVDER